MLKPKTKTPRSIKRGLLLVLLLAVLAIGVSPFVARQKNALAATNSTINFQARLLTAAGNVVPDGVYNVEFKLYAASTGGTALWTETRTDGNKVTVKNGYLTVNLGSVTAFGGGINWDQELWLTMNIGGTGSPSWDGEMNPRLKLTSVPYAFRSGAVVSANGSVVLTVDESDTTGKICVQNSVNCGFVQGDATDFIQNSATVQTGNLFIQSASASSVTGVIQGASGQTADIFQVQNSAGTSLFKVAAGNTASFTANVSITGGSTSAALTVKSNGNAVNNDLVLDLQDQNGTSVLNMYNQGTLAVGNTTIGKAGMVSISNGTYFGQLRTQLISNSRTYDLPDEEGIVCLQDKISCGFVLNDVSFDATVRTLTLGGTGLIDFDTPKSGATNVKTKISIPAFDPGAFNQVIALGVATGSNVNARVISLFDGRVHATSPGVLEQPHQPTLSVFDPSENDVLGFSWDGSSTTGYVKTMGAGIGIRSNTTDLATFSSVAGINLLQDTAVASGKNLTVHGTLRTSTIDAGAGGQIINIGGANALGISLNENTAITGTANSNALTVSNGSTTGNIAAFRDNTTDVVTIEDGGAFRLQNSADSRFAFTVKNQAGTGVMRIDTVSRKIAIGSYDGTDADNITGQLDILPAHDNRIGLSVKGYSPTYNSRYIQVQNSAGSDIFFLQSDGNIQTASGVFMSNSQSGNGVNSNSASFKTGDVSGTGSASGTATFKSGDSTTSGNTGAVNLMSGNATSGNSGNVAIDVGSASGTTGIIYIGTTNASTVAIGNSTKNSTISMDSGTGNIMIGTGAQARSINIGTGAAAQTVVLGSQNTTSTTTVNSGSGGTTVNTTGGFTANTGTTGATFKSANSATAFRILNANDVPLFAVDSSTDRVYIGNPTDDAIGALLVLDSKNSIADPTGVPGGMYYNSVLGRMRCYEMSRWTDCTSSNLGYDIADYTDEFMTGSNTSGTIGALGWTGTANVPVVKNGEANHPGLLTLSSTSTLGTIGRIVLANTNGGGTPGNPSSVFGDANYVAAIIRPLNNTAGMHVRVGITNDHSASGESGQGIYWSYNSATSANWRTITKNSGNTTANTTSTAYSTGTWYKLEIRKNTSGNWEFYMNGVLQFTHSSNIPSDNSGAYPFIAIENADGMPGKTIDIDWFRYQTKILAR